MKALNFVILMISMIFINEVYSQNLLNFNSKITFDSNKKKKAFKKISEWANSQTYFKISYNNSIDTLKGVGIIEFINQVKYETSPTYSRLFNSQTNGKIEYQLLIVMNNNEINISLNNYKHLSDSKNDKIEFGILTNNLTAPENLLTDYNSKWCNNVWINMKSLASNSAQLILNLVPANLFSEK